MTWALLAVATILACELLAYLPILERVRGAADMARRAVRLIANAAVSDHWKERVVPSYALRIATGSLTAFGFLVCALAPYIALVLAGPFLGIDVAGLLLNVWVIAAISVGAIAYLFARSRLIARLRGGGANQQHEERASRSPDEDASDYSRVDRALHRLVLAKPERGELLFQLEGSFASDPPAESAAGRHVFVAGLARAGTTVLMRAIHESGSFASLTYRDMPFVMAPNLWAKLSRRSRREIAKSERAHGDGVMVDFDSPEALEEPFWRTFCGEDYIGPDGLSAHEVDAETIERYRAFVNHVLARYDAKRYLAKNNNNILRLPALLTAFPNACVLIPFRAPLVQSFSLQRQHARFASKTDDFTRDYMSWLAHHEFGQDRRPFVFNNERPMDIENVIDFWLSMWVAVHRHLLSQAKYGKGAVIPVAYEDLCAPDQAAWHAICGWIGISPREKTFSESRGRALAANDPHLQAEAEGLYSELRALSRTRLNLETEEKRRA